MGDFTMQAALTSSINLSSTASVMRTRSTVFSEGGKSPLARDVLQLGSIPLSNGDSMRVVLERAMEKLRAVVGDARAELGIPEGAVIDTSAEATAGRIADFALGAFETFKRNHGDLGGDEARQEFVAFIGAAINQGISEARGILDALSALNPEVGSKIDTISGLIQQRLDDFLANV